ncbi:MAG: TonB-dependent receptor plug domain-containing protein, partial [Gemmatimonadaceae bacterium]
MSTPAFAEDECARGAAPAASLNGTRIVWPSPLDRAVSLRLGTIPLRTALDRVAQVARLRLSYSRELLPLDRSVCLSYDAMPVGDVLARILEGTGVEPVALGNDQVVLAPQRRALPTRATDVSHDLAVTVPAVLSPVVVRDLGDDSHELPAGTASTTIAGDRLISSGISTMSQLMNGSIPGMWVWGGGTSSSGTMAQYGSLRGASSFGVGSPKVYIDGIEMANPLMLNQLDPASIKKLEVIRGPQGSALFGNDAIDGVILITTRQDGATGNAGRVSLSSETGVTQSGFASGSVLSQEHSLNVRAGTPFRSASLGLGLATLGDYVPGASSRRLALNSSARLLGTHGSLSAIARLSSERVGNVTSPLLAGLENYGAPL